MIQATEEVARQYAAAARNRAIWRDVIYNVKDYGAKGDGVKDDTYAITRGISEIKRSSNGRGTLLFPPGRYRITDTIEIDIHAIRVEAYGATILSDGANPALRLVNEFDFKSVSFEESYDGIMENATMGVYGLHLKWKSGDNAVGIHLEGKETRSGVSNFSFHDCLIDSFPTCIQSFSHSWNWNFIGGCLRGTLLLDIQDGGEDYFERIGFYGTTFVNNMNEATGIKCWRSDGILNFVNCSFDFLTNIATMHQGRASFYGCHFESDKFADYWFILNNDGTQVSITDSEFFPPGMSRPLFFVNETVKEGGLFLSNVHFTLSQVDTDYHDTYWAYNIVAGDGPVNATGVVTYSNDWPLNVGIGVNELPSWDFEGSVHGFTFVADNLGNKGDIVTTESHTSTHSMKLSSNGVFPGQSAYIDVLGSKSGKRLSHSFWAKIPEGVQFYSEVICMTVNEEIIETFTVNAEGTGGWKFYFLQPMVRTPQGTQKVRLKFSTDSNVANTVYVDDVILNFT